MEGHAPARGQLRGTAAAAVLPEVSRGATGDWPVVILSGGVTGLGVLRAFSRAGIRAYVYPALEEPVVVSYSGLDGGFVHAAARSRFGVAAEYIAVDSVAGAVDEVSRGGSS